MTGKQPTHTNREIALNITSEVVTMKAYRLTYSLPLRFLYPVIPFVLGMSAVSAQEALAVELQFSATVENIEEQLNDNRQFVEDALQSSQQLLQSLTAINPETGLPAGYDPDGRSGFSDRVGRTSEAQFEFIENYAALMQLRTANLFELWADRSEDRAFVFMQTGSLYDVPVAPPVEDVEREPRVSVPPDYFFPGFDVPPSGFFAQPQYQP